MEKMQKNFDGTSHTDIRCPGDDATLADKSMNGEI